MGERYVSDMQSPAPKCTPAARATDERPIPRTSSEVGGPQNNASVSTTWLWWTGGAVLAALVLLVATRKVQRSENTPIVIIAMLGSVGFVTSGQVLQVCSGVVIVLCGLWAIVVGERGARAQERVGRERATQEERRYAELRQRLEESQAENSRLRHTDILDARDRALALCLEIEGFLRELRAEGSAIERRPELGEVERTRNLQMLEDIRIAVAYSKESSHNFHQRLQRSLDDIRALSIDGGPFLPLLDDAFHSRPTLDSLQRAMIHLRTIAESRMTVPS